MSAARRMATCSQNRLVDASTTRSRSRSRVHGNCFASGSKSDYKVLEPAKGDRKRTETDAFRHIFGRGSSTLREVLKLHGAEVRRPRVRQGVRPRDVRDHWPILRRQGPHCCPPLAHSATIKAKANLPIVFMQCGIHAREWISHATCLYIIDQLATRYEKDEEIRRLVSAYEWRIHPVVNPDGYDYTHTKDRYWRKTRSKSSASEECLGADANRNFETREFCKTFDGTLSSPDPCSLTYCGDSAFSEVETRAIRDAVMATRNRTEFFFDLHSYGTMWMFPYGYTDAPVPEYDQLLNISRRAAEAIEKVKGSVYRVGAMYQTIYPLSGCSSDWAYDKAGVKKSFAIELQPRNAVFDADFGFLHPSKDIVSTATEAWEGIKAAVST
ncbi:carboxypeptidase B-like isoform X1 [Dermacentor albipictus]|uniref:carboxypeptidase B-like isoform X1 n=1 Tax=Dermacentor albipictus TaxID=60249 RepID=UPI0038FCA388